MKKFEKDLLAIGRNDYLVTIITDDDYNVIKIIAEEDTQLFTFFPPFNTALYIIWIYVKFWVGFV